jgi:FkbM family methyltransferase
MSGKISGWLRRFLARSGLQVRRLPRALLENPGAELRWTLDHVVAHHLARALSGDFFVVQVGAFDGRHNDPLHDLVVRHGWRGVLVEPQRDAFRDLVETYSGQPQLELRNVAIAERAGSRELYKIAPRRPGLPYWATQLASFQRETLISHRDVIPDIEELIETELVPCATFEEILATSAPERIDLLQIDAEGFDDHLVRLFHATGRTAEILCFEHKHLGHERHDACCADLVARGYRLVLSGPDTIAYRG